MSRYSFKTAGMMIVSFIIFTGIFMTGCGSQNLVPDPGLIQIQTSKPVIYDTDGANIKVATSADRNQFEQLFLTTLNWKD